MTLSFSMESYDLSAARGSKRQLHYVLMTEDIFRNHLRRRWDVLRNVTKFEFDGICPGVNIQTK